MPEKLNLYQKIIEIRKEVKKFNKDTKGYQYKYVSGFQVLSTIRPLMDELNVLLIPNVTEHTWDTSHKGEQILRCKMDMTWINGDDDKEQIHIPFYCFGQDNDISKAFGKALTYSERYFLLKFFNIPTDEADPDANQSSFEQKKSDKDLNERQDLICDIMQLATEKNMMDKIEDGLKKRDVDSLNSLTTGELKAWHKRVKES